MTTSLFCPFPPALCPLCQCSFQDGSMHSCGTNCYEPIFDLTLDSSFTLEEVGAVLHIIQDWDSWTRYAFWRSTLAEVMGGIRSAATTELQQREAFTKHLVHFCPSANWGALATTLSHCGERKAAERAASHLPKGM